VLIFVEMLSIVLIGEPHIPSFTATGTWRIYKDVHAAPWSRLPLLFVGGLALGIRHGGSGSEGLVKREREWGRRRVMSWRRSRVCLSCLISGFALRVFNNAM
jgi:hypothetical protein